MNIGDTIRASQAVIKWAVAAATEQVGYAKDLNEEPDSEGGMGLWQSFQAAFPKQDGVDYDLLIAIYQTTYRETVIALVVTIQEVDPSVFGPVTSRGPGPPSPEEIRAQNRTYER